MKKRSKTIIICVVLLFVAAAGLGVWALVHYLKTQSPDDGNAVAAAIVDMNDSTPGDYGKIYYAPIDEKHIAEEGSTRFIDNEVLIVVKDGVSEAQVRELAAKYNSEIVGAIEVSGDYQLRLKEAATKEALEGMLQQLKAEDIIYNASLNHVISVSETGDEAGYAGFKYGNRWKNDLKDFNDCKGLSWGIEAINTMGAWRELNEHKDRVKPVRVGLIDTGFDFYHDDLGFAEVFYENGKNGETSDDRGHGTHVAGIMAAKADNDIGICGVYPYGNGNLYGVCNCGQGAIENKKNTVVMAEKISYAELIVRNVKVINSSRGAENYWEYREEYEKCSDLLGDFLNRMLDKGYDFVIVTAAGNGSRGLPERRESRFSSYENLISPDKYPDVFNRIIVVGAVDYKLEIAAYSDAGERVDIYAPGGEDANGQECVFSTLPGNTYGMMYETSIAAPHVAGVAAMVWSANNALDGALVKRIILRQENRNQRCKSCHMVDAHMAVSEAFRINDDGKRPDPENGVIMSNVVERFHEKNTIANADVTLENIDTNELFFEHAAGDGHLEASVPAGRYKMSVYADGYEMYVWPDEDNYATPIVVEKGQINYLDWVKLRRSKTKLTVHAYDSDTGAPITDKEMTITLSNPVLTCDATTQRLDEKNGVVSFYVNTGKIKGDCYSHLSFHIDGYVDCIIKDYRLSEKSADSQELVEFFKKEELAPQPVGYINDEGYVVFGHYEQDGNAANGKEPIEWVLLDENENGKLLVSRYVLDCVPYNQEYADVTWETCTLRKWLNDDFMREAFAEEEMAQIRLSHVANSSIMGNGGNDTEDKVFCLSLEELAKYYKLTYDPYAYFGYNKNLITAATAFAKDRGVWTLTNDGEIEYFYEYAPKGYMESCAGLEGGAWWLRTKGWEQDACAVLPYGYAGADYEFGVSTENYGVRPAVWVNSDSIKEAEIPVSQKKEITFGRYAGEDIEWIVLAETNTEMFVISKYVIEGHKFNDKEQNITWENSWIRKWLNETFLSRAFTKEQRESILTTTVKTPPNPISGVDGGKDTEDRVFLLSIDEVYRYFPSERDRTAEATEYAIKNSVYLILDAYGIISPWWLRSMDYPGTDSISCACSVTYDGEIASGYVDEWTMGVRPAMWISKDAVKEQ